MELFKRNSMGNPLNAIKESLAELAPGGELNLENLASELPQKPALKFENKTIERPQDLWMRVALTVSCDNFDYNKI